ncbi:MAG: elongator complex protein 3 [Patescibacteria group bacterium]|jgi:elongator complex protein 3
MNQIKKLLLQDISKIDLFEWTKTKRRWAKEIGRLPKNSEIAVAYKELVTEGKLTQNFKLEKSLKVRKVRTLSGVAPFAVMMKPFKCPGNCVYCVQEPGMPKSYMSDEPAAARAKLLKFDPKTQVKARIEQMEKTGHKPEKLQIIVIGGTFSAYPNTYKREFLKAIFDTCNGFTSKTISEAQNLNEKAKYRIIGMSIETRPDWITENEVRLLRKHGVTKVQMGVQALDEKILTKINRGHSLGEVAKATQLLRNAGFKINYHFMPNLPGSTPEKDIEMAKVMFSDDRFKPDTLKLYPCIVLPNTPLQKMWERGEYKSYSDEVLIDTLVKIKQYVPGYCRIDRLVRDITKNWTVSGTKKTNMRQLIKDKMKREGLTCNCIRCREVRDQAPISEKVSLQSIEYQANGGKEVFLSFEDSLYLYGMVRLRLPGQTALKNPLFSALKGAALIRELQVFGQQATLSKNQNSETQHKSLGKQLVAKAEKIAKDAGFEKLAVISGVGVRDYYRSLGYELKETYMVKNL